MHTCASNEHPVELTLDQAQNGTFHTAGQVAVSVYWDFVNAMDLYNDQHASYTPGQDLDEFAKERCACACSHKYHDNLERVAMTLSGGAEYTHGACFCTTQSGLTITDSGMRRSRLRRASEGVNLALYESDVRRRRAQAYSYAPHDRRLVSLSTVFPHTTLFYVFSPMYYYDATR